MISVDDKELKRLTKGNHSDIHPHWSPEERRVAFLSNRAGSFDLWLVDSKNLKITRLTKEKKLGREF